MTEVFLRDVDGTGSLHPCAKGDAGAMRFWAERKEIEMSTMIIGSPEHKDYQRNEVDQIVTDAANSLNDEGVFTPDQIKLLQEAFWSIRHAIHKVI